ncbi:unnamed protein product [Acanthoscelides obtectus]|uniref:Synaptic plasticity regulator PANTS n=1 Tax=Acanthoscelides obtectus TaxID=200917 RepID=A0A9P0KQJ9_ACAOB|nr:unnamed protein product [Acanthoscelides obtectus]CAK1633101.1 hypothetical protein AOBTE_LOCUS7950 [Acanthoscelides obtectus]
MTTVQAKDENSKEPVKEVKKIKDQWMIRPCRVYDAEYSDCTSFAARFNQYFIYGKTLDCSQWKKDSISCHKWIDNEDAEAARELVHSEKVRRRNRLLPHVQNDVWQKRKEAPADWNKPLPEHMQKEYENTYLNVKSKELKGEVPPSIDLPYTGGCTIL